MHSLCVCWPSLPWIVHLVWLDFQGLCLLFLSGGWNKVRTEALSWNKGLVWRSPGSLSHTGYPSTEKGRLPPAPETQVFPRRPRLAGQKAGRVGLKLPPLLPRCNLQKGRKSPFLSFFLFCWLVCSKHLYERWAHSRYLINIYWMNEKMNKSEHLLNS